MTVDYDTLDPLVRRDSYQDLSSMETGELYFGVFKNPPFSFTFLSFWSGFLPCMSVLSHSCLKTEHFRETLSCFLTLRCLNPAQL